LFLRCLIHFKKIRRIRAAKEYCDFPTSNIVGFLNAEIDLLANIYGGIPAILSFRENSFFLAGLLKQRALARQDVGLSNGGSQTSSRAPCVTTNSTLFRFSFIDLRKSGWCPGQPFD
jgi:hypothetical protein